MGDFYLGKNRYIQVGLIILGTYLGMRYISPLVSPFLIAALLILYLYPKLRRVKERLHIKKRFLAAGLLLLLFVTAGFLLWLIGSGLIHQLQKGMLQLNMLTVLAEDMIHTICMKMEEGFGYDGTLLEAQVWDTLNRLWESIKSELLPGLMGESMAVVKNSASFIGFLGVLLISMVLIAKDYGIIGEKLLSCNGFEAIWEIGYQVVSYIRTFLKAQLMIMAMISTLCGLTLWISGVSGGFFLGILTGILDMLPFIGSGLTLFPLAIFLLLGGYYGKTLVCLLLYASCVLIREFMEPKLIGDRVGLWPVAILFAIYAGIKLFGIAGIVKGPISLVIICESFRYFAKQST